MSWPRPGASQASEARAVVSLPAASRAVRAAGTCRGRARAVDGRAVQSTVSGPAAGCGAPRSPTGSPSVSITAQSTVTPSSAGALKASLSVPGAVGAVGLT